MFDKFPCLRIKIRGADGKSAEIEIRPSLIRWLLIALVVVVLLFQGADPGHLLRDFLHVPEAMPIVVNGRNNWVFCNPLPRLRLLPGEFRWLPMFADLGIADYQLRPQFEFPLVFIYWLIIEPAHNLLPPIIAILDAHPHPLTDAGTFVRKLDLDVVASLVLGHVDSYTLNPK
jgi:hypothetical protein